MAGKQEIVELVQAKLEVTKKEVEASVDAVIASMKETLLTGEELVLTKFISIKPTIVPAREMKLAFREENNIVQVPEKVVYKAKVSKALAK